MDDPRQITRDLRRLSLRTDRLADLDPLLRCLVQSAYADQRRAARSGNLVAAEDWRRASLVAGELLQATQEASA